MIASSIKNYFSLAKPGLILGNVITFAGGFALAARGRIDFALFAEAFAGISLVMASGCVFNNYIDRDIDGAMERTRGRALVIGSVSGRGALIFASAMVAAGTGLLWRLVNPLAAGIALAGFFVYVALYSLWSKRKTVFGTFVGAVSGAVPPVVGYAAVTNRFDAGAAALFAILFFWQLPHFFAIALYRLNDYRAASIPVFPARNTGRSTKLLMLACIAVFSAAAFVPAALKMEGAVYIAAVALAGAVWLELGFAGFHAKDDRRWARKMFFASLAVVVLVFAAMSFDTVASKKTTPFRDMASFSVFLPV